MFRAVITALLLASPSAVPYQPPVPDPVTKAFVPPKTQYSAGHRGVEWLQRGLPSSK